MSDEFGARWETPPSVPRHRLGGERGVGVAEVRRGHARDRHQPHLDAPGFGGPQPETPTCRTIATPKAGARCRAAARCAASKGLRSVALTCVPILSAAEIEEDVGSSDRLRIGEISLSDDSSQLREENNC